MTNSNSSKSGNSDDNHQVSHYNYKLIDEIDQKLLELLLK